MRSPAHERHSDEETCREAVGGGIRIKVIRGELDRLIDLARALTDETGL